MTKSEFIAAVAKRSGQTAKDVQLTLKHFQLVLIEELEKEGKVNILDLGQFKISERAARTGVNPRTKQKITIEAKKMPRLVASRKFKDFISGSGKADEFNY